MARSILIIESDTGPPQWNELYPDPARAKSTVDLLNDPTQPLPEPDADIRLLLACGLLVLASFRNLSVSGPSAIESLIRLFSQATRDMYPAETRGIEFMIACCKARCALKQRQEELALTCPPDAPQVRQLEATIAKWLKPLGWTQLIHVATCQMLWRDAAFATRDTSEAAEEHLRDTAKFALKLHQAAVRLQDVLETFPNDDEVNVDTDLDARECPADCPCASHDPFVMHLVADPPSQLPHGHRQRYLYDFPSFVWQMFSRPKMPDDARPGFTAHSNEIIARYRSFYDPPPARNARVLAMEALHDRTRDLLRQIALGTPAPTAGEADDVALDAERHLDQLLPFKQVILDDWREDSAKWGPPAWNIFNMDKYDGGLRAHLDVRQHFCFNFFSGIHLAARYMLGVSKKDLTATVPSVQQSEGGPPANFTLVWPEYFAVLALFDFDALAGTLSPLGKSALAAVVMGIVDEGLLTRVFHDDTLRGSATFARAIQGIWMICFSGWKFLRAVGEVPPPPFAKQSMLMQVARGIKVHRHIPTPHVYIHRDQADSNVRARLVPCDWDLFQPQTVEPWWQRSDECILKWLGGPRRATHIHT